MKSYSLLLGAMFATVSTLAAAQNIRWNQVTPGNMDWSGAPGQHGVTTYNQIGPLTFGSDGSRGYTPSQKDSYTPPPPPAKGNHGVIQGDTFLEYDPSGNLVRRCTGGGGRIICTAP